MNRDQKILSIWTEIFADPRTEIIVNGDVIIMYLKGFRTWTFPIEGPMNPEMLGP